MLILLLIISAFASFKLAEEKEQNKILWTVATAFFGPTVLAIQYLISWYRFRSVAK